MHGFYISVKIKVQFLDTCRQSIQNVVSVLLALGRNWRYIKGIIGHGIICEKISGECYLLDTVFSIKRKIGV